MLCSRQYRIINTVHTIHYYVVSYISHPISRYITIYHILSPPIPAYWVWLGEQGCRRRRFLQKRAAVTMGYNTALQDLTSGWGLVFSSYHHVIWKVSFNPSGCLCLHLYPGHDTLPLSIMQWRVNPRTRGRRPSQGLCYWCQTHLHRAPTVRGHGPLCWGCRRAKTARWSPPLLVWVVDKQATRVTASTRG